MTSASNNQSVDPALLAKFPELIPLLLSSQSMNGDERAYWLNILPIMTPEQVQNLQDILINEKRQLAAIDAKYAKEVDAITAAQTVKAVTHERAEKRNERLQTEAQYNKDETELEQNILNQIDAL